MRRISVGLIIFGFLSIGWSGWNQDITAGKIRVDNGIYIKSNVPSNVDRVLYANETTLYWNGTAVGSGSGLSGLTANYIPVASGSSTIVNSGVVEVGANVGIGSTTPQQKLDIEGSVYVGSGGNVGIGTAIATEALTLAYPKKQEIFGTTDTVSNWGSVQLYHDGNNAFINSTGSAITYSKPLRLQHNYAEGNPGVSYLEIARNATPWFKFYVNSTTTTGNFILFDFNSSATSGDVRFFDASPTINQSGTAGFTTFRVSPYLQATGSGSKILFDVGTNSSSLGGGTHTSKMLIDSSGNVGIGSTTPQQKLDVEGSVYVGSGGKVAIGTTSPTAKFSVMGDGTTSASSSVIVRDSTGTLNSQINDDGSVYIRGNVGIGTSNPQTALHVMGSETIVGGVVSQVFSQSTIAQSAFRKSIFTQHDSDSTTATLIVKASATPPANLTEWQNSSSAKLVSITSTGNVGINTSSPQAKLEVEGTAYFGTGNVGIGTVTPRDKLDVDGGIYARSLTIPGKIIIDGGLYTLPSGNVGIGTSSANHLLDVNGVIYINGAAGVVGVDNVLYSVGPDLYWNGVKLN